jgi:hypothetical protein
MAEDTNGTFPWEDLSMWLKRGIVAARIVNKFMMARWPEQQRPSTPSLRVQHEELDLLSRAREVIAPEYCYSLDMARGILTETHMYQEIPEESIQSVWDALTEYATSDKRFDSLKDQLTDFLKASPDGAVLMQHIWESLGPAVAHESMIEHTHS